jgi:hypothetical protein
LLSAQQEVMQRRSASETSREQCQQPYGVEEDKHSTTSRRGPGNGAWSPKSIWLYISSAVANSREVLQDGVAPKHFLNSTPGPK